MLNFTYRTVFRLLFCVFVWFSLTRLTFIIQKLFTQQKIHALIRFSDFCVLFFFDWNISRVEFLSKMAFIAVCSDIYWNTTSRWLSRRCWNSSTDGFWKVSTFFVHMMNIFRLACRHRRLFFFLYSFSNNVSDSMEVRREEKDHEKWKAI